MKIYFNVEKVNSTKKYQMADDFRKFTESEMRKAVGKIRDIVHKRVKRIESNKLPSPALHALMSSGGELSTQGKNLKELQKEYARGINFLNMPTSSLGGAKAEKRRIEQKLGVSNLTRDQLSLIFEAFRAIKRAAPGGLQVYGSERLLQYLADEINKEDKYILNGVGSQDWDYMIKKIIAGIMKEYEDAEAEIFKSMTGGGFSFKG